MACVHASDTVCIYDCDTVVHKHIGWADDMWDSRKRARGALTRQTRPFAQRARGGWDMTCHLCVADHHHYIHSMYRERVESAERHPDQIVLYAV